MQYDTGQCRAITNVANKLTRPKYGLIINSSNHTLAANGLFIEQVRVQKPLVYCHNKPNYSFKLRDCTCTVDTCLTLYCNLLNDTVSFKHGHCCYFYFLPYSANGFGLHA